jgi:hypothetical protein
MVANTESILDSTKKYLGLGADYDVFDQDIMMHINSVFVNLHQLGIGPAEGFAIENAEATWDTFLGTQPLLNSVKQYVFFKVRLAFDPPSMSFVIAALEKQILELEWRMSVTRDELSAPVLVSPTLPIPEGEEIDGGGAGSL